MCEIAQDYTNQLKKNQITKEDLQSQISQFNNTQNLNKALKIIGIYLKSKTTSNKN